MTISAVVTTLDNLPLLKEQVPILLDDPLVDDIIIVNNGSRDSTAEWLSEHPEVIAINRENLGAGPGRNAGLDAAGECDYYLMLDGGIRPLRDGTRRMLDYLESHSEADVIGVEIPDFETDYTKAWRRWPNPIEKAYHNTRLSHTAYCLARYKAFDGLRFSEEGPFGEPGWGVDDDEMACRWRDAGIIVHVVTGVHPYRRGGGSYRRLFLETGIWPNQYGSVYEKRLVHSQQNWPQYYSGVSWGEQWLTVVVHVTGLIATAKIIKLAHDTLRKRLFDEPWSYIWNPYSIMAWANGQDDLFLAWAELRRLRQHHGDTIIAESGLIIRRTPTNEETWTGDFRIWREDNWKDAIRPGSFLYCLVETEEDLKQALDKYNIIHPCQGDHVPPGLREDLWQL